MSAETTLLFALLAFRRGRLTRGQLLEATARWMRDPDVDLAASLVESGRLSAAEREELEAAAADWRKTPDLDRPGPLPQAARETIVALKSGASIPAGEPTSLPGRRYEPGTELGRGGIGRVVEAIDHVLGRPVALKLLHEGNAQEVNDRFRWEARITGRLEHPNIVPVHDVGVLPATGELFMSMKRIVGRDMGCVIEEGVVPQRRLIEALRDACRAVSYAHARGVIHRDLKPANIMLGDFGEVLVVDWGLARLMGEDDRAGQLRKAATRHYRRTAKPIASTEETVGMTLDGDILGTPAYMPPEQAMGWLQKIDERSDVYALGATLYEILAGRPPFLADTTRELLEKVLSSRPDPPSKYRPCAQELETVCLRAMAHKAEERYPTVADLSRDLDAWLEGALERDRRRRMAVEAHEKAAEAAARWRQAEEEILALEQAIDRENLSSEAVTVDRSMKVFAMEDRVYAQMREGALALAESNAALDTALSLDPSHTGARRLKARIHWELFLSADRRGDRGGMEVARRMAEVFNDGSLDAQLRGDGALELRTRRWACPCLVGGREVAPAELYEDHWVLWSGARTDGGKTAHAPELAAAGPLYLRVHGRSCRHEPIEGAEVWAFRYDERDYVLVPCTPETANAGPPVPAAVLDALFGNSPYRPRGPGLYLGRTPIARRPWPMGSWLLILSCPGRIPQRLPFSLDRLQNISLDATLYLPDEVPQGHLPVLGGVFNSIREAGAPPLVTPFELPDFFMARFPVTAAEYAAWLNTIAPTRGHEAQARRPRVQPVSGAMWPWTGEQVVIPTAEWQESEFRSTGVRPTPDSLRPALAAGDWERDWPILGVSWIDGMTWCRDRSLESGWATTLPTMFQWERAGRGGDRRQYPWGDRIWPALSNTNRSLPGHTMPASVDSFPSDESPWGIRGLGGNMGTACLNDAGVAYRNWRAIRGGAWARPEVFSRLSYHQGTSPTNVRNDIGIRSVVLAVAGWA